ncbi:DUF2187 family protein [Fictibacillus iocasae]|uniref:DUF2187 family protein n=1 Tax=Fictibacillus iocasae TaxID=2715437 RepID=A0ABW2NPT7_9BACL
MENVESLGVKTGDTIVTTKGWKGVVTATLTNTVVVDFSSMENYEELFEHEKQVVRVADIKELISR